MGKSDAPSRHDRKGHKRPRVRANDEHVRTGLILMVVTRAGSVSSTFGAHTRRTLARAPIPVLRGRYAKRPTERDLERVLTTCRCGKTQIPIARDLAEAGYQPRCLSSSKCW